eukprot:3564238-Pleurochrysis_carterae.AAC.7
MASAIVAYDVARASAESIAAAALVSAATAHACAQQVASCSLMYSTRLLCRVARLARTCVVQASRHCTPKDPRRSSLTRVCITTHLNAAFDAVARCALHATKRITLRTHPHCCLRPHPCAQQDLT